MPTLTRQRKLDATRFTPPKKKKRKKKDNEMTERIRKKQNPSFPRPSTYQHGPRKVATFLVHCPCSSLPITWSSVLAAAYVTSLHDAELSITSSLSHFRGWLSWTTNSGHFPHGIELDFLHCHVSTFFVILSEINSNTIAGEFWSCLPTLLDFPLIPRVGFGGTRNPNFLLLITKDPPVRSRLKPWRMTRMTRMTGGREYPLGIGKQDQPLTRSIPLWSKNTYGQMPRQFTECTSLWEKEGARNKEIWFDFNFL